MIIMTEALTFVDENGIVHLGSLEGPAIAYDELDLESVENYSQEIQKWLEQEMLSKIG